MASRVGLVHDYLLVMRGAERTFREIAACWPEAPIYTSLYSECGTGGSFAGREISTSSLQRFGLSQRGFRRLLPLYPRAIERLPVDRHDLIISSSSAFAHGVRPAAGAVHVCYCHTPFRYAWHAREQALAEAAAPLRPWLARSLSRIAEWDLDAANRVSGYIANSELTRERIGERYGREAAVVHPPVDVERFEPGAEHDGRLLLVSELVSHKRVEVALEAARLTAAPIVVVGDGPERKRLAARYADIAEFRGRVDDRSLERLYASCMAAVVPACEEFGIVAVEAQAAGKPVVALAAGGARETVLDGETGILVADGDANAFAEAIRAIAELGVDPEAARCNAERFSVGRFRDEIRAAVDAVPT